MFELRSDPHPSVRPKILKPKVPVLYRLYDKHKRLLYIGRSINPLTRVQQHFNTIWGSAIAFYKLEFFDNEQALDEAERTAIKTEAPLYNAGSLHRRGNSTPKICG